jgi:small-conductance mechanosensitive channel
MEPLLNESIRKTALLLLPLVIVIVVLGSGYGLRAYLQSRLSRWARRSGSEGASVILGAIRGPYLVLCLMLGIYAALEFTALPKVLVGKTEKALSILTVVAVSMVVANLLSGLIRMRAERVETILPVTSLTENIIRVIVYCIGGLIILNAFGISIAPILATLGVGGLAVALALKDTLSNFFAGFHIVVTKQIRVGDYLKLDSGEEGFVADISWRTTQIRTQAGNLVLVPNAKLTELIVTNYALPEKDMAVQIGLSVHYASDLSRVERVICETAAEVMREVPGGVPDFAPVVRYHTFADSGITLNVIMRASEFATQFLIKHEFIKRIHARFAREGIVIPYPIRALNYDQEKRT